ncbi:MAG: Histidine kinase [Micavibrio sp.]|nr:Histidine kinase [Micavibrio sp.]
MIGGRGLIAGAGLSVIYNGMAIEPYIPTKEELNSSLAAIVESSDDAIISKTLQGLITSWNESAAQMFGYTAEEALGQHIHLIIPDDRRDEEFTVLGRVSAGEKIDHFETRRKTKNGRLIDISLTVSPIRNAAGDVVGVSNVARDIGAIKDAERASAYLAAIVGSSDDAIISKNLDGVITSWNTAAQRVFGYTAEEAIGQHISLIIPEDSMDEEYAIIGKVRKGERVEHFETIRRTKSGAPVTISLTVSPILDSQGKIIGASKVARDITKQKQTEKELLELNQKKDEFMANMSHELRTPMNAVIGLASILGMSKTLTNKETQYVSTLKQSAESLMTLIDNLLDFSKLEMGSLELEEAEFNLPELIEKTTNMMGVRAREKGLVLRTTYASPLNRYYIGDGFRIQQTLINLLSNAVKFTEEGSVELKVSLQEGGAEKSILAIEVIDSGIGIPEDKVAAIFDKFVQADASTTRKYGGTGLGLAIARAFAEKMGGRLSVSSRVGLGSNFLLELPLRNSARHAAIDADENPADSVRKNILVVEDYEPNVVVITAMLDILGYSYDCARNGLEAVRIIQTGRYDLILMDVQMAGMDGLESTQRIRAFEAENNMPRTPIIAMTAHVQDSDKAKCLAAGMDDFIGKPFDPAILTQILLKAIPASRTL